jgi:hypothetical protein
MKNPVTFYSEGYRLVGNVYYPAESFNPEWVVGTLAPRPSLFITTANDRLVPPMNLYSSIPMSVNPRNWSFCRATAITKCTLSQRFVRSCRQPCPGIRSIFRPARYTNTFMHSTGEWSLAVCETGHSEIVTGLTDLPSAFR